MIKYSSLIWVLRERNDSRGCTIRELADATGMSPSTIRRWVRLAILLDDVAIATTGKPVRYRLTTDYRIRAGFPFPRHK